MVASNTTLNVNISVSTDLRRYTSLLVNVLADIDNPAGSDDERHSKSVLFGVQMAGTALGYGETPGAIRSAAKWAREITGPAPKWDAPERKEWFAVVTAVIIADLTGEDTQAAILLLTNYIRKGLK